MKRFVIQCQDNEGSTFYVANRDELTYSLASKTLKTWGRIATAHDYLSEYSLPAGYDTINPETLKVIDATDLIGDALKEIERKIYQVKFDGLQMMASPNPSIPGSGTIYQQMLFKLAQKFATIQKGDTLLYYHYGLSGRWEQKFVTDTTPGTFTCSGVTVSRIDGASLFLPDDDNSLVDYFVSYAEIQSFISNDWAKVPASEIIKIAEKISRSW